MTLTVIKGIHRMPDVQMVRRAEDQFLRDMIYWGEKAVKFRAPKREGHLQEHLAHTDGIKSTSRGNKVQMGYLPPLKINQSAPRSTIKRFLQWYRYARVKGKAPQGRTSRTWTTAWYYLDIEESDALRAARYGAKFGGPHPPPTYAEAVNAGKVPLPAGTGAYAKARHNIGFIERIRGDVQRGHKITVNWILRNML